MDKRQRLYEILTKIEFNVDSWNKSVISTDHYWKRKQELIDQILALDTPTMSEEEIEKVIQDTLRNTPIAGDFDKTHAIYANEAVIIKLAKVLTGKIPLKIPEYVCDACGKPCDLAGWNKPKIEKLIQKSGYPQVFLTSKINELIDAVNEMRE